MKLYNHNYSHGNDEMKKQILPIYYKRLEKRCTDKQGLAVVIFSGILEQISEGCLLELKSGPINDVKM